MKNKRLFAILIILIVTPILCVGLYQFPALNQRIGWYMANLRTQIFYKFNPPDQVILDPSNQEKPAANNLLPTIIPTFSAVSDHTPSPTIQPALPSATSTSPAPVINIPSKAIISGIPHEYQSFNNCGPANLSMVLRFWGWQGDQRIIRDTLRSNENDANVMPDELAGFVESHSELKALYRIGGTLHLLKQFIIAGFPVIIESGHQPADDWWMGHYVTISGYDDEQDSLITQDSLIMPDLPLAYEELADNGWRDFNNLYLVIYPLAREQEVFTILNQNLDPTQNVINSLAKTSQEIPALTQRAYFFALYNQGADQLTFGQTNEAVESFDQAFAFYQTLKEEMRPWRVLWYRVDPYEAYYKVGRYQSVIDLASATLSMLSKRGLEESHYWRGLAYEALGNEEKAIFDFEIALQLRPDYTLALEALARIR